MALQPANSTPDLTEAMLCATILGEFHEAALTALLGRPAQALLQALVDAGVLSYDGTTYTAQRSELAQEQSLARQAALHTRAAEYYRERMQHIPDQAKAERAYVDHLVQSCELLLRIDPTTLHTNLTSVPFEQLTQARDRHLLRYYLGLGAGLADRLSEARTIFAALLQEPELDAPVRGRALNSGALFAQMQGDYQQALDDYTASLAIWKELGLRMREANALHNLGILRYELHDLKAAENHFLASSAIYRELNDEHHLAMSSNELGLIYRDQGRWQQAQDAIGGAATIFEREQAENSLGIALGNLGEVALAQGQYTIARRLLERSLSLMNSQVYAVDTHINLGLLEQATANDQAALGHYQAARTLADQLGRREIMALIEYREGHALQRLGNLEAARKHYEHAMAAIEDVREPLRDQSLLISLMGRWQLVYESALWLAVETGDIQAAFNIAERARARAFTTQLLQHGTQEVSPVTLISPVQAQAQLSTEAAILSFFCLGLRGPEANLLAAMPAEAAGLRSCLLTTPALIGILLTGDTVKVFQANLDPNTLQGSVGRNDGTRFLAPAILRRLYSALITPIAWELESIRHLSIMPHGPLHHLPFAALLRSDNQPLLQQVYLAYAPSVTVLLRSSRSGVRGQGSGVGETADTRHQTPDTRHQTPDSRQHPADSTSVQTHDIASQHHAAQHSAFPCLALGYAGMDGSLPHAEAEAQGVAQILGGEHWRGEPGIRAAFLQSAGNYRYLHLACHGEFNLDDPLDSWLELGPQEILSATDMLNGPILRAELVTLSACRSGISRVLRGDEPMGLARGFLGAGAHAVLVTLWQVEDSSAHLLMTRFYSELQREDAGLPEALHAAQQFVRTLSQEDARALLGHEPPTQDEYPFAEAFFWAAYCLIEAGMSAKT